MLLIISSYLLLKSHAILNDDANDNTFEVDSEEVKDAWSSEDRPKPTSTLTMDDFSKMTTKDLKKKLALKGQNCKGCAEKADFVKLAFESQDLPDITVEPISPPHEKVGDKDKNMDDIMEKLRQSGFNGKFFNKNDMAGMKPEDMEKMFKSSGLKTPRADRKKEKNSNSEGARNGDDKKKKKTAEADSDVDSSATSTSSSPDSSSSSGDSSSSSSSSAKSKQTSSDDTNDSESKEENFAAKEKEKKSKESSDSKSSQKDKSKEKPKDKAKAKAKAKEKVKEKPQERPKDSFVEEDIDNIEL